MSLMLKVQRSYLRLLLPAAVCAAVLTGCDFDFDIDTYDPPKDTPVAVEEEAEDEDKYDFDLEIEADPSLLIECEFGRVVDGDTIIVYDKDGNKLRVRLTGINAPESVHPDEEMNTEEGKEASDFLKELLEDTEYVYLEYDVEQFDQYDRTLAYVWLDDDGEYIMLNEIMLSEGYAEPVFIKPNLKYADYFDDYKD